MPFKSFELNCFISHLVSSFIQITNKEFWKVGQYTMIRLIKHETLFNFKEAVDDIELHVFYKVF